MSKSKNALELIFGSKARVKMLKFLFRNPELPFGAKDLAVRVQESRSVINKEIKSFLEIGLIKIKK